MLEWLLNKLRPIEARSSGSGYTAQVMAARDSYISGRRGVAELTATAQGCISLWEGGFAMADVAGTDLLTRQTMAMIARTVALNGEAVLLIGDLGLVPATDWDVTTRDGQPRAYRLSIPEAGGGRTVTALAAEVLHLRIGADHLTPWIGTAPLRRSSLTGALLHAVGNRRWPRPSRTHRSAARSCPCPTAGPKTWPRCAGRSGGGAARPW